jgi:uncharacterized protein YhdP
LPLNATEVNGDFDIEGGQLARADLKGRLLGGAFRATARAPKARPLTRTQIDVRGTLSGEALRTAMGLPAATLQGLSDWHAVVKLAPEPARERSLHVSGSLAGLDIKLPQPLSKPYGTSMPSWLDVQWPSSGVTQVNLGLGAIAARRIRARTRCGSRRLAIDSRGDSIRRRRSDLQRSQIVNIGGSLTRVDLTGWLHTITPDKAGKPLSYYLKSAKLAIGEVDFIGLVFRSVELDLAASADRWRLGVDGPNLAGTILMPMGADSNDAWDLHFDHVKIDDQTPSGKPAVQGTPPTASAAASSDEVPADLSAANPRAVPAMHFSASEFSWDTRELGVVQATLTRHDDGISLDELTAINPSFTVKAQGEWRGKDTGSRPHRRDHSRALMCNRRSRNSAMPASYRARAGRSISI